MDEELDEVDPARAFEELRAEVVVARRAVEDLPRALAATLPPQPPDYGRDLGMIISALADVNTRLAAIEAQPGLTRSPSAYAEAMRQAGKEAMGPALTEARKLGTDLAGMIGQKRGRKDQRFWLLCVGAAALFIGLVTAPIAASVLPPLPRSGIARVAMGEPSRWAAGQAMMKISDQPSWARIVEADTLVEANAKAIAACKAEAAKTGKPQDCRIVVKAAK